MTAKRTTRRTRARPGGGGVATAGALAVPQLPLADLDIVELPLGDLESAPFQHRTEDAEALQELAASLAQDGQLEAIIARTIKDAGDAGPKYEIVAGHRRVAALRLNGATAVRAQVLDLDDEQAFRAALIDNMKRNDLEPLDEARTFHFGVSEAGWTVEKIADWIGRPRDFVNGRLRLLKLDPAVRRLLEDRAISIAAAELLQTAAPIKGALPQLVKRVEPGDTVHDIEREVEAIFRDNTIPLGKETPFAYEEECARLGCLGKNPAGAPVCLNRANYVRLAVELNNDAIAAAVERYRAAHKDAADLKVYYELSAVEPGWHSYGYRPPAVKGYPPPPASGKGIIVKVPDERSEFAQGKIPVALLSERQTDRYGVTQQTPAQKAKSAATADTRRRHTLALQPLLKDAMQAAVDELCRQPARALAAGMVTRYRVSDDLQLEGDIRRAMDALKIKLPGGPSSGDGLVQRLASLDVARLHRIIAAAKVWKLDNPYDYATWSAGGGTAVISAKRLRGSLAVLLGANRAALLLSHADRLQKQLATEAKATAKGKAARPAETKSGGKKKAAAARRRSTKKRAKRRGGAP